MDDPQFRPNRLRDLLGQTRDLEIFTDGERGAALHTIVYWESIRALADAGIDALHAEPDSIEETMLVAMIVHYANGLCAGYGYAKLPRRL